MNIMKVRINVLQLPAVPTLPLVGNKDPKNLVNYNKLSVSPKMHVLMEIIKDFESCSSKQNILIDH